MKNSGKRRKGNPASHAIERMGRLSSRITQAYGAFHTEEVTEGRYMTWWELISVLAVTPLSIEKSARNRTSGSTPKPSNIIAFSPSLGCGSKASLD